MMRVLLALALLAPAQVCAEAVLYAASVRGFVGDGAALIAGNLYKVDLKSGAFVLVGAIRVNGTEPIGITGLADRPATGELYGITSSASPNHPHALVTVDTATANARLVGDLGAPGSDIAFDAKGRLFVWLRESGRIGLVDLATGRATPIGEPRKATETGGLAIDEAKGIAHVAVSGAGGTLDHVDLESGLVTPGPKLVDAPYPGGINSLTLSPTGTLFAVNTNLGHPANTLLVRIDTSTGVIAQIGPLPNETDALVFVEPPWSAKELALSHWQLIAALSLVLVIALVFARTRERG